MSRRVYAAALEPLATRHFSGHTYLVGVELSTLSFIYSLIRSFHSLHRTVCFLFFFLSSLSLLGLSASDLTPLPSLPHLAFPNYAQHSFCSCAVHPTLLLAHLFLSLLLPPSPPIFLSVAPFFLPRYRSVDICTFCNPSAYHTCQIFNPLSFYPCLLQVYPTVLTQLTLVPTKHDYIVSYRWSPLPLPPVRASHQVAENLILAWPFLHPPLRKFMSTVSSVRLHSRAYALALVKHPEHPNLRLRPASMHTLVF